jgi:hypothetical protein
LSEGLEVKGDELTITLKDVVDMKWVNYALMLRLVTETSNQPVFATKTIQFQLEIFQGLSAHFSQTKDWNPPTNYEVANKFPVAF